MKHINGRITMLGTPLYSEKKLSRLIGHLRQANVVAGRSRLQIHQLAISAFSVLALSMLSLSAQAGVINGSFEQAPTSSGPFVGLSCTTILSPCVGVPGWTTASNLAILLVATGNPGANVSTYLDSGSPAADGVQFIGTDGAFGDGVLTQTLTGLMGGQTYALSFDYAAAQLNGNYGATTEQWVVTIGGTVGTTQTPVLLPDATSFPAYQVISPLFTWRTSTLSNCSGCFTPWSSDSVTFTVPGTGPTSELLGFLAVGSPAGIPPFVLLDNVSVDPTPEPGSLALLGVVLLGLALIRRQQKKRA